MADERTEEPSVELEEDAAPPEEGPASAASEGGELTSVPLTELQTLRLKAAEMTVALRRLQVTSEIDKRYAVARAIEAERALQKNMAVKMAEAELDAAVNQTLGELETVMPEGYSASNLEWEKGIAHVSFAPEMSGQRIPVE